MCTKYLRFKKEILVKDLYCIREIAAVTNVFIDCFHSIAPAVKSKIKFSYDVMD